MSSLVCGFYRRCQASLHSEVRNYRGTPKTKNRVCHRKAPLSVTAKRQPPGPAASAPTADPSGSHCSQRRNSPAPRPAGCCFRRWCRWPSRAVCPRSWSNFRCLLCHCRGSGWPRAGGRCPSDLSIPASRLEAGPPDWKQQTKSDTAKRPADWKPGRPIGNNKPSLTPRNAHDTAKAPSRLDAGPPDWQQSLTPRNAQSDTAKRPALIGAVHEKVLRRGFRRWPPALHDISSPPTPASSPAPQGAWPKNAASSRAGRPGA